MFISAFDTEDEKSKFEKIYYKYRDMLYACALKIVKNSADAEDVLHDAFIKTAKSIKHDRRYKLKAHCGVSYGNNQKHRL